MRSRLGIVLVLITTLAAASAYKALQQHSELKTARSTISALKQRAEASERLLVQRTEIALQQQESSRRFNVELQDAIKEDPEWGSTAVPAAVTARLCSRLHCRTGSTVRAPGSTVKD